MSGDRTDAGTDAGWKLGLVASLLATAVAYDVIVRFVAPWNGIAARAAIAGVFVGATLLVWWHVRRRWAAEVRRRDARLYEREQVHGRELHETQADAAATYRALFDGCPMGVVAVGNDGLVESWNAAAQKLFGHDASHPVGKPITALIPGVRTRVARGGGLALADFIAAPGAVHGQCADGGWAQLSIRVARGCREGYLVFMQPRAKRTRERIPAMAAV